ncbi:PREDICTED: putative sodium-coupled neutral amino acid transporter 7 [Trachymyrmex cornetzi]|uniref:Putative sodium-coupled neutral amino acid transporter 7 n=1 Tax=Trachymyrmex cornetzi TaxID=471704 RepID=A0A195EMB1_9HYME|nr:PREDICTED: putative sodium-coupled neutral amino acid transporter 7 [Trachymyrmex cornetzi]KYN29014.1 Putative sodium-coupled neutral amino acid transporter 7 [Trachymyrmex cornetzi]
MDHLVSDLEPLFPDNLFPSTEPSLSHVRNNETPRGAGVLGTIFLIVNTTLGAGLLNFPQAFDKAGGIGTCILAQLVLLVFITATLVILASCSNGTSTDTMQDTFAGLCGSKSLAFCGICVAVYSFGCCLTFLIIVGDQFDRVFATYYGLDYCHTWYLSRPFVTALSCTIFVLPLCFFKRLDILSYASSIGCITVIYVVWVIIYKSLEEQNNTVSPIKIWPNNGYEILQIIPIVCFAYQSHMTAIPTYACMKDRNLCKFTLCAVVSMLICYGTYSVVGYFGYATFGSGKVPSDILQGYTDKSAVVTVAVIAIAIKNFTTYPIVLYCGRDALLSIFNVSFDRIGIRVIITLIWFILSLGIAILVPDISPVINLLGSLSAMFIFILPGICLLQNVLLKDPELYLNKGRMLIVFAIFLIALGAFVCGVVFMETLQDLRKTPAKPPLVTGFRQLRESLCV